MTKSADMATLLDSNSKVPGADIASGSVTVSAINATGTPSASTFLRGDGSWNAPAGGVTSLTAGNGITVSASTGAVTVSQDIYTGSSSTNLSFPVGTVVMASTNGSSVLATTTTVSLGSTTSVTEFRTGVSGNGNLTGTWKPRGTFTSNDANYAVLLQRTA